MDITTHASQWGYDWDSKAIKVGFQWILNRDSNSQLVRYFHHDDWSNVKSGNQSSIRCCNIKLAFYCFQDDYLLQHNGECRGFKLKGVQYTAINLRRTFICPRWHSLKSPAFAGFFAVCNWLPLYKNTQFFSNFSPIYAPFLKTSVLGKAKYGGFSHGKSRVWQLTCSHQSMPVIDYWWISLIQSLRSQFVSCRIIKIGWYSYTDLL